MQLKKVVNFTNGVRHQLNLKKDLLSKYNNIIKKLITKNSSTGGRNNTGRITVRHIGSGCKKKKHILFSPSFYYAITLNIMYNQNSNSFIALNFDLQKKIFFKTIATQSKRSFSYPGSLIQSNNFLNDFKIGNVANLKSFPIGSIVCNIASKYSINNNKYAKSAGCYAMLLEKINDEVKLRLPSGNIIKLPDYYRATLGEITNRIYKNIVIGKAGKNRLLGIRPSVRGIAMNPVDHPHGGRSNKGMPQVTPWGIPTKNQPTVKKK